MNLGHDHKPMAAIHHRPTAFLPSKTIDSALFVGACARECLVWAANYQVSPILDVYGENCSNSKWVWSV